MQSSDVNNAVSNPQSLTRLIIVMGVSGSGKSTLAKALAERNHYVYLDGDDFHSDESKAMMAKGIPLTDVQRAPWVESIKKQLEENNLKGAHTVLAFSGLKKKHRDLLRSAGLRTIFLFLDSDKSVIQTRLDNRENHFMAPNLLDSQYISLENTASETDIYPINVAKSREEVVAHAQQILEAKLLQ